MEGPEGVLISPSGEEVSVRQEARASESPRPDKVLLPTDVRILARDLPTDNTE